MQHDKARIRDLAYALLRIAKDQVVVRYQVLVRYCVIELDAELFSFDHQRRKCIYRTFQYSRRPNRNAFSYFYRCGQRSH